MIQEPEQELNNPKRVEDMPVNIPKKNIEGKDLGRKSVKDDKAYAIASVASSSVGQSQLKYETVTLVFGSGDITKTAAVTSGDIILGVYSSSVTSTPAYGELQLSISNTTLTGTRSASPGGAAAITYTIILLKS